MVTLPFVGVARVETVFISSEYIGKYIWHLILYLYELSSFQKLTGIIINPATRASSNHAQFSRNLFYRQRKELALMSSRRAHLQISLSDNTVLWFSDVSDDMIARKLERG
jgi:hypothetical protein